MEEKERYELFGEHCIKDNNPDARCQLLDTYKACVLLNEQDKENQQLKQQLAEKEKEIEQLKKFDDLNKTFFELFRTAFKEPDKVGDLFNTLKTIQEKQDQDKISFAVEQLEKVKRTFIDVAWEDVDFAIEIIDDQINGLKEEIKNE